MATALCIRHDELDTFGVAPDALREGGLEPVVVCARDLVEEWPDVADFDAFVIFGGTMSSLQDDRHPYLGRERDMLRRAIRLGKPTLGVCLGGQLLAQASGAEVRRAREPEVGFEPLTLTPEGRQDPVVAPFEDGAPAFEWHEDEFDLPGGATLLATGAGGSVQSFRIGSALGVQFHPEVDAGELASWIEEAGEELGPQWGRDADDFRAEVRRHIGAHIDRGRAFFTAFARQALAAPARRSA